MNSPGISNLLSKEEIDSGEWPQLTGLENQNGEALLQFNVQSGLAWFDGHFPDNPVLPGVVQVHWAVEFARRIFAIEAAVNKVENLKFKTVVQPEVSIKLQLNLLEDGRVKFLFNNDNATFSEGRLTFF